MTDKPTGRVVALIVLLIVVAAALRGYLPSPDSSHAELGGNRAALMIIVAVLSVTLALVAMAVVARLRDPVAVAPNTADLSELLGSGRGRPNWRVLLIGLAVVVAWLLLTLLLSHLFASDGDSPPVLTPDATQSPSPKATAPPPRQNPPNNSGDVFGILLASTVPFLLIIVTGAVIMARRRRRAATSVAIVDDYVQSTAAPPPPAESLARAAELGLAEIADLSREPREAIIACYAAMERELAQVPDAAPQDFDTATEVLARAVEHHALHADNAVQLVNLFAEARFSPHVMNEGHREVAVRVLRLVLDELGARSTP